MKRRTFLKLTATGSLTSIIGHTQAASPTFQRVRPGDADWPSDNEWEDLKASVGGNLIKIESPLIKATTSQKEADTLFANIQNPYFIGDHPGLTQTLGWIDAWTSQPSVYAVAARHAGDVAAAVNFAREHKLRLVVKGGGHSYQGTSNAPDSLLIWTRHMNKIVIHDTFVPQNCDTKMEPQRAVTLGAGVYWLQAYEEVTTKNGLYVQGGGCTTVGVAGLIQSGGFGNFSKHFGTAASNLLEAEVVTADGEIRIVNEATHPDLFWALKGGGGGTFGVITKVTLRVHELPEFAGGALLTITARSDEAFRRLVIQFILFYRDSLFNQHWGESVSFTRKNQLNVGMVQLGLSSDESQKIWKTFLDWLAEFPTDYVIEPGDFIGNLAPRHWWDAEWHKEQSFDLFDFDARPGAPANRVWWKGDGAQVGWVIYGFESLWLSQSLLDDEHYEKLAHAIFSTTRHWDVMLQFNKALARSHSGVIEAVKNTATHPCVCDAFALAIVADDQEPAYPGIVNHEPDLKKGRAAAIKVRKAMNELRAITADDGAYVSESNYFEKDFQRAYWGDNYPRLAEIKKKYDPDGLFFVHNGVGSESWSSDGFSKRQ